jgi:hypothetical protein
MASVGIGL